MKGFIEVTYYYNNRRILIAVSEIKTVSEECKGSTIIGFKEYHHPFLERFGSDCIRCEESYEDIFEKIAEATK